jgi:hypothetical protein
MTNVEHVNPGFQWADPLKGKELAVELAGNVLQITGLVPLYEREESPCDLIHQFDKTPKQIARGQSTGTESPEVSFANADTDEKLITFIRRFGPVVATCVNDTRFMPDKELDIHRWPCCLMAYQDMQELRNEQAAYRAALALVMQLNEATYDYASAQQLIKTIAVSVQDWPRQWEREKSQRWGEPEWKLSAGALERIQALSSGRPDLLLPKQFDGRVVICELLNSFPSIVFPNVSELHGSIKYGIRPLLYSLLRHQFLYPRGFAVCANTECRNFFNIERAGQNFCGPECSIRHRQRVYWQEQGKKLRKNRTAKRRKSGGIQAQEKRRM